MSRVEFAERARATEILSLAAQHGAIDVAEGSIRRGDSLPEFRTRLLKNLVARELGGRFSFRRLLDGMRAGHVGGLERELLQNASKAAEVAFDPQRVLIPWSVFQRDLTVASAGAGGYLAGTTVGDALDILRPWSVTARAGITVVEGLREAVTLPKTNAKSTGFWLVNEAIQATESTPATGFVSLSPKNGGAYVEFSRQFGLQTAAESYIRRELLRTVGSLIDAAVINGSGAAGQPTGVLNTSGIGTQSGTSLAWSGISNMKETVATANGRDENIAFVGTPAVREVLEGREKFTGAGPIWNGDDVGGRPGYVTTDVPAATLIAGDWSEVILGLWGPGLIFEVNPYAGFQTQTIGARVLVTTDVAVKHAGAFCSATSIT